ncbi:DUF4043 family protein [Devosia sp. ZB163]|uniref:phage capsid family protein n=1 Tax=Devosia sp. ZB163 TaxID=3025938 RepID=UPI00235FC226|nr:DUF4043 family protein [Devosia sp. ZB163]MDC9825671.1 DUF4043 family protein [Devosia sp. ZB163]
MALTPNHPNNEVVKFRKDVATDFLRKSRFDKYMGDDSTSIIVRMADLDADGKEIRVPLVTQLSGDGVGTGQLRGNEEQIDSYGMPLWADWARNGVANNRAANKESSFSVRSTARSLLRGWARRIVRDDLVDALLSIPTSSIQSGRFGNPGNRVNGIKWAAASASDKNSWVTSNYDRVVFGAAISNYSTTFATAVGNVDSTSDKMSVAVGSLMKDQAKQSGVDPNNPGVYNGRPKITPYLIEDGDEEWYVCFCGSRGFRDLKADPVMVAANREARSREGGDVTKTNPLFTGGSLVYDGVIYVEIPEITQRLLLKSVGASTIDVEPVFLCGQGALAYVTGQMPRPTQLEDGDYDFITGMGIEAQYGTGKIAKAPLSEGASAGNGKLVDWGMVTGFVAGVANQ